MKKCYRRRQAARHQTTIARQQATDLQQTERYTIALKQLLTPHHISTLPEQTFSRTTTTQPLFDVLSNVKLDHTV